MDAMKLTVEEQNVMRVIWDRGGASAREVVSALAEQDRLDHAGALKLLRKLDTKGAVERHHNGRDAIYKPKLTRETARTHVLGRLFDSLPAGGELGLNVVVLRESDMDPKDWADLQAERAAKAARLRGRD